MQDATAGIADRVRGIAARHRATHSDIASLLGIQRATVSQRMNAKVAFTATEIYTLAGAWGEDVAEFFPKTSSMVGGMSAVA